MATVGVRACVHVGVRARLAVASPRLTLMDPKALLLNLLVD